MYFDLTGRIAFLTGPEGNLGPIWKQTLEANGAKVFGAGLPDYDLTDNSQQKSAIAKCVEKHGAPDILVHNTAIDNPPGSDATFFGNFERILDVNLGIAVKMTELVIPYMLDLPPRQPANITFIGSMLGFRASNPKNYKAPFDKPAGYGASKAALWNFCTNLIRRYSDKQIVCNMLALSAVLGNQDDAFKKRYRSLIPIARMLQPEDFEKEFLTCVTAAVPYDMPLFVGGGFTV